MDWCKEFRFHDKVPTDTEWLKVDDNLKEAQHTTGVWLENMDYLLDNRHPLSSPQRSLLRARLVINAEIELRRKEAWDRARQSSGVPWPDTGWEEPYVVERGRTLGDEYRKICDQYMAHCVDAIN